MIVKDALAQAVARLTPTQGADARGDAVILLAHALGLSRSGVTVASADPMSDTQVAAFDQMVSQRVKHQPVSQIIGSREFWGLSFIVTGDVLDPRADTETLVEVALDGPHPQTILDLGTGTGCILLSLLHEWPAARGVGVDISDAALRIARQNAQNLTLTDRVTFVQSNWFTQITGTFDLITSNPPYITAEEMAGLHPDVADWEPHLALTPGGDGLDPYRTIAKTAKAFLAPNGRLLLEFGWQQAESVSAILDAEGWKNLSIQKDLGGNNRVLSAYL